VTKLRFLWEQLIGWTTGDQARVTFARKIEQGENWFIVHAGSVEYLRAVQLVAATLGLSTNLNSSEGSLRVQGDKLQLVRLSRIVFDTKA
jgi:hypothetical protein